LRVWLGGIRGRTLFLSKRKGFLLFTYQLEIEEPGREDEKTGQPFFG